MSNITPHRKQGGALTQRGMHPLAQLQRDFDALMNRFFGQWEWPLSMEDFASQQSWDFDVRDEDKEVTVRAELPGFDANDLDVQLNNNVLTIRAEKKQETEPKEGGRSWHEERFSSFRRSVTLPQGIDADKVEANFRNGVLELHLPKTEQAHGKRIAIRGDGASTPKSAGGTTAQEETRTAEQKTHAGAPAGAPSQPAAESKKTSPQAGSKAAEQGRQQQPSSTR